MTSGPGKSSDDVSYESTLALWRRAIAEQNAEIARLQEQLAEAWAEKKRQIDYCETLKLQRKEKQSRLESAWADLVNLKSAVKDVCSRLETLVRTQSTRRGMGSFLCAECGAKRIDTPNNIEIKLASRSSSQ